MRRGHTAKNSKRALGDERAVRGGELAVGLYTEASPGAKGEGSLETWVLEGGRRRRVGGVVSRNAVRRREPERAPAYPLPTSTLRLSSTTETQLASACAGRRVWLHRATG